MRHRRPLLLVSLCLGLAALPVQAPAFADDAPSAAPADLEAYQEALQECQDIEDSLVKAVDEVRVNTVAVQNLKHVKPPGAEEPILVRVSGGSGVIIRYRSKLWILTNVHVTANHEKLRVVTHDGEVRDAILHDSIPEYDIALLRFSEQPKRVKFRGVSVSGRHSERGLNEGTWVIATGNPFFLGEDGRSVTTLGVISGLDRFLGGQYQYVGAIQHDAEVNPGNSGGPLWDLKGNFIGINGKIAMGQRVPGVRPSNTGAAFSLPVHQVEAYLKQLVGDEDAEAGFLGIDAETFKDDQGKAIGAKITKIDRRSPAANDKDKDRPVVGDVITKLIVKGSSKTIYTASDLREHLSLLQAGTRISLKYKRGRRSTTWKCELGNKGK